MQELDPTIKQLLDDIKAGEQELTQLSASLTCTRNEAIAAEKPADNQVECPHESH